MEPRRVAVLHHRVVVGVVDAAKNIGIYHGFAGAVNGLARNQVAVSLLNGTGG